MHAAWLLLSLALTTPNLHPVTSSPQSLPADALAGKPQTETSRLLNFCARGQERLERMDAKAYADWMRAHGSEDFTPNARVRLISHQGLRELTAKEYLTESAQELGQVLDYREDMKSFEIQPSDQGSVCIAIGEQIATVRQGGRWVEVRAPVEFHTWIVEEHDGLKVRRLDIFQ
ncbi:MAG: hypothetical protein KC466_00835 [Myxococcales bacterium]|nr:hypothetical protein [Myxococcales bacterium]